MVAVKLRVMNRFAPRSNHTLRVLKAEAHRWHCWQFDSRWLRLSVVAVAGLVGCAAKQDDTVKVIAVPQAGSMGPLRLEEREEVRPPQRVTADQLYTIYSQNLIEGANPDQRFRARRLHVTGVFEGINRSLPPTRYVELQTHDKDAFVYAEMSPDGAGFAATLMPGTPVQMLCRGEGMVGGSPLLGECRAE